jgi:hypothetical protein
MTGAAALLITSAAYVRKPAGCSFPCGNGARPELTGTARLMLRPPEALDLVHQVIVCRYWRWRFCRVRCLKKFLSKTTRLVLDADALNAALAADPGT